MLQNKVGTKFYVGVFHRFGRSVC